MTLLDPASPRSRSAPAPPPRRCWLRTDLEDFAPRGQWSGHGGVALLETRCGNITTGKTTLEQRC